MSNAGTLVGLDSPGKLRNLDVKPYVLGSDVTNNLATPAVRHDGTADFGVDAKWGITQSVVTDFTYNTDFAQVEDDEAQVNLTRFSVLFPEKREFFLEGQGVFNFAGGGANQGNGGIPQATQNQPTNNTPVLFFSRRIGLQSNAVIPILGAGARRPAPAGHRLAPFTCARRTSAPSTPPTSRCFASSATSWRAAASASSAPGAARRSAVSARTTRTGPMRRLTS